MSHTTEFKNPTPTVDMLIEIDGRPGELVFIERAFPTQISPNRDIGVWLRGAWKGKIERSTDGTSWNGVFDDDGNALEAFAFGG